MHFDRPPLTTAIGMQSWLVGSMHDQLVRDVVGMLTWVSKYVGGLRGFTLPIKQRFLPSSSWVYT